MRANIFYMAAVMGGGLDWKNELKNFLIAVHG